MSNQPPTLPPPHRDDPLWPVTAVGFGVMLSVGTLLAAALSGGRVTEPLSAAAMIAVGYGTSLVTTAALIGCDRRYRPLALRQMNLTAAGVGRGAWLGLRAAGLILPIVYIAAWLSDQMWNAVGYRHPEAHPLLRVFRDGSPVLRWLIVVLAAIVAPLGEELLFRGHLQLALTSLLGSPKRGMAAGIGIGATSMVFALFHSELWMMPPLLVLSIFIGVLFHRSHNIVAAMVVHVCFNAVNLLYFWLAMT